MPTGLAPDPRRRNKTAQRTREEVCVCVRAHVRMIFYPVLLFCLYLRISCCSLFAMLPFASAHIRVCTCFILCSSHLTKQLRNGMASNREHPQTPQKSIAFALPRAAAAKMGVDPSASQKSCRRVRFRSMPGTGDNMG